MSQFKGLALIESILKNLGNFNEVPHVYPWKIFFQLIKDTEIYKKAMGRHGKKALEKEGGRNDINAVLVYTYPSEIEVPVFAEELCAKLIEQGFAIHKLECTSVAKVYPDRSVSSEQTPCIKGAISFEGRGFVFLFALVDIEEPDVKVLGFKPEGEVLGKHFVGKIEAYSYKLFTKNAE